MNFYPKKFLNADDEGGGSGNSDTEVITDTADENKGNESLSGEHKKQDEPKVSAPLFTNDELKNYGFDSPEALKTFLQKQKEENVSPEEKIQKENIAKANFLKFSAEQKDEKGNPLLKIEDYNQYESLKAKPDQELVFENFKKEYKEDHPEITDPEELEEAAKDDFEYEYKLKEGFSESAKKKGLAKIARDAKDLRSPSESKVTAAQTRFKEYGIYQESYPKFEKFIKESITKNTPDKTILFKAKDGEEEIPIEIELTQKERDAMFKEFSTPKTFHKFLNAKPEEIQSILDKKMQGWVKLNKFDEVNAKTFELGLGAGTKKGSTVGAENPFPLRQNQSNNPIEDSKTLEENNAKMSLIRQKLSQTR